MNDPRSLPDDRPNVGRQPLETEIQALQGEELPADQDGALAPEEIEGPREATLSEQEWGTSPTPDRELLEEANADEALVNIDGLLDGDVRVGMAESAVDTESLDALTDSELRTGETTDPLVAIEEGDTWVPPTDPPVIADPEEEDGIVIAAGVGRSALDDPYDDDHRSEDLTVEGDMNARIRDAIRADSATSPYADRILIAVVGSTAILRGVIDDVNDSDTLVEVAGRVTGIENVVDQTEVAGLG